MTEVTRRQRMHVLRKSVKRFDVHWWARKFLGTYDDAAALAASLAVSA
jgi:trehalose-6-phosphate synthase